MTSAEHTSRPQTTRLSVDDDNMHDGDSQHSPKEDEISARSTTKRRRALAWIKAVYHNQFSWISGNMSLRSWKPVIRSAIAAWISLLLIVVPTSESALGQASFLLLATALLSPPNEPFVATLKRELNLLAAVCFSWTLTVIALALANLTRTPPKKPIDRAAIFDAKYMSQVAPNAIIIVFLAMGAAFFQYLRARLGPGPYGPATVYGCISIDIMMTNGALYPYPYYKIGRTVAVPIAIHSAISIACAALIFPESFKAQFTKRLIAVFTPLSKALKTQPSLLKLSPHDRNFDPVEFQTLVSKAEAALIPLRVSSELLKRDISFGKLCGTDLEVLLDFARRLTVGCEGLAFFYRIIDPLREGFPQTRPATPMMSHMSASQPVATSSRRSSVRVPTSPAALSTVESERGDSPTVVKPNSNVNAQRRAKVVANEGFENDLENGGRSPSSGSQPHSRLHTLATEGTHGNGQAHWYRHSFHLHQRLSRLRHHGLHMRTPSLLHEALHHSTEQDVGLFESQIYMNIESRLHIPRGDEYIETAVGLLGESSSELLTTCAGAVDTVLFWLECNNTELSKVFRSLFGGWQKAKQGKFTSTSEKNPKDSGNQGQGMGTGGDEEAGSSAKRERCVSESLDALKEVLENFKAKDRLKILGQYVGEDGQMRKDYPPHRYLFQMFVYHFHLLELAECLVDLLAQLQELNETRTRWRIWAPMLRWRRLLPFALPDKNELDHGDPDDDEDPDAVEGLQFTRRDAGSTVHVPLNQTGRRDPDALPPTNAAELLGSRLFQAASAFGRGNLLFALKVAVLTALVSLPAFIASSAAWAFGTVSVNLLLVTNSLFYTKDKRWVWVIIMAQLTSSRFKGETGFNLICRVTASFCGGIVGMTIWYISSGSGQGNPYGLAAVCAVFFPLLLFFRIYYPGPPVTTLLTSTTVALIIGYSYKDKHNPGPATAGHGFTATWRRFLFVIIGVTAAFLFSFLPPTVTVRQYQRTGHSTVIMGLGTIFSSVISIASSQNKTRQPALDKDLILIRRKIRRFKTQAKNAAYEFSLRGKWPAGRYTKISNLLLEIAYLLSHLYTVVMRMDGVWVHAFLARARLLDPDFLGRMFSTITMLSSSLRNGTPLPQITAAPLIDLANHMDGFNVVSHETDYGLPHIVTPEVLANEQYLCFSVGVASVNGIVTRLDKLTLAVKELVGENFHIEGVEIPLPQAHPAVERQRER